MPMMQRDTPTFCGKRRSRSPLTREENIEEARLVREAMSRICSKPGKHGASPHMPRLEERDRLNQGGGPPLSIVEQSQLRGLKTLFPKELPPPTNFDDMVEWKFPALCALVASDSAGEPALPSSG